MPQYSRLVTKQIFEHEKNFCEFKTPSRGKPLENSQHKILFCHFLENENLKVFVAKCLQLHNEAGASGF